MPRAVWSGSISFGLVSVPVKAFTAVHDHTVHFNQLEKGTGARVKYEKVSSKSGDALESDEIELGYEIRSGRYVTFDQGELDDLRPESTKAIDVSDFVPLADIDPIYYERTYWLAPADKQSTEPYQLLLAAMEDRGRVGIGTVIMRNKQYLAAIRPLDGALAMSTMRFADEVVPQSSVDTIPSRKAKVDAKAMKLAAQIIDALEGDWDPAQYKDTYTEQLKKIIDRKDKGKDVVTDETPAQEAKVLDLMAALEASVSAAKSARKGKMADALATVVDELATDDDSEREERPSKRAAKKKAPARKAAAVEKQAPAKRKAPARKSA